MIFRALDVAGDWTFGKGIQNYQSGQNAIALNIQTRLYSFINDCFFDAGAGIDWLNLLGSKNQAALIFSIKSVILNTPGVNTLKDLGFNLDANRHVTLTFAVTTVYGAPITGGLSFPVTPFDGVSKYVGDIYFDGTQTTQDVDVSSLLDDARRAVWILYDESDGYSVVLGAVQPLSITTVRLTISPAPPAGFFRLVGIA